MNARTRAEARSEAYTTGVCRIGEHRECDGNKDIKVGGIVAIRLRCACNCHKSSPH
ncbi:hypothetical protein ABCR94_31825 [Streptomyces sp. 21So2-11]|uniref:hypothetical protein n=1 Tax=Streptomyces sp. 21So2-11 TaxID=3144408 RepID=UPI003219D841